MKSPRPRQHDETIPFLGAHSPMRRPWRQAVAKSLMFAGVLFVIEFSLMNVLPLLGLQILWVSVLGSLLLAFLSLPVLFAMGFLSTGSVETENIGRPRGLERRMWMTLAALVGVLVTVVLVHVLLGSEQLNSPRVLNLAGRQRMLSQRIVKAAMMETLQLAHARFGEYEPKGAARTSEWCAQFERNLQSLLHGNAELGLPPCPSKQAAEQLRSVRAAWHQMQGLIRQTSAPSNMDETAAYFAFLEETGDKLLVETNAVVTLLERHYERQAALLRVMLGLTVAAASAVALLLAATICQVMRLRERSERRIRTIELELAHVARVATMGQLAAGIAHELNQPLTAITSHTESCKRRVLSGNGDSDELCKDLEEVVKLAMQAGATIRRLRDFIGTHEPHRSSLNINDVVKEASSILDWEAQRSRIPLRLELAPGLPTVLGDSILIQQVILNLARNALDAMIDNKDHERGLIIRTTTADRTTVEIAVSDTGPGVPAEEVERLFEPFFSTKPDGMGLGLAISRSITEANSGHLTAEPNSGRGMTFRITLPASEGV